MSRITVLKQAVVVPEGKKYKVCELGYKTDDGKVKGMRIFGFGDHKAVFDVASTLQAGDVVDAQFKQNDKGYWEFAELTKTGLKADQTAAPTATPARGNWETPEERAQRQIMIVRQSSLSNAVTLAAGNKEKAGPDDIIGVAKIFEAYVLDKPTGEVA